jgi:hypothetical protein
MSSRASIVLMELHNWGLARLPQTDDSNLRSQLKQTQHIIQSWITTLSKQNITSIATSLCILCVSSSGKTKKPLYGYLGSSIKA